MKAILGEKLGMTQVFDDESRAIPVTVIKAGPCRVVQIKNPETDGYSAIQISYHEVPAHKLTKAEAGHFGKSGVATARHLVEIRVDDVAAFELGQEITIADVLEKGGKADVSGVSKGKGFQGVMKRHNFSGQGASHGVHKVHRAPGAIGACATPARVFKGQKMAGRMGGERVTVQNLKVLKVMPEKNLLVLKGAVPGHKNSFITLEK